MCSTTSATGLHEPDRRTPNPAHLTESADVERMGDAVTEARRLTLSAPMRRSSSAPSTDSSHGGASVLNQSSPRGDRVPKRHGESDRLVNGHGSAPLPGLGEDSLVEMRMEFPERLLV